MIRERVAANFQLLRAAHVLSNVTRMERGQEPVWIKVAIPILSIIVITVLVYVVTTSADKKVSAIPSATTTTGTAVAVTTAPAPPTEPPTTADADMACRSSFAEALAAGTEQTKFATLGACTEEQWVRMQSMTPLVGATLAALCDARYGLVATSCQTADAERIARDKAAAAATTTSPPAPRPTVVYVPVAPPTTQYAPPTTRYVPPTTQYVPPTTRATTTTRPPPTTAAKLYAVKGAPCNNRDSRPYYEYPGYTRLYCRYDFDYEAYFFQ